VAVASAGPCANHLHLASDRQPRQHLITHFYRPVAFCRLDAAPLEDATIYACLSANCNGTGAYPREYQGTYTSKLPKLDLRTDAKYVANLAECQYVLVNMQQCRLLHGYSMPA